jgi:hypothetical protein
MLIANLLPLCPAFGIRKQEKCNVHIDVSKQSFICTALTAEELYSLCHNSVQWQLKTVYSWMCFEICFTTAARENYWMTLLLSTIPIASRFMLAKRIYLQWSDCRSDVPTLSYVATCRLDSVYLWMCSEICFNIYAYSTLTACQFVQHTAVWNTDENTDVSNCICLQQADNYLSTLHWQQKSCTHFVIPLHMADQKLFIYECALQY